MEGNKEDTPKHFYRYMRFGDEESKKRVLDILSNSRLRFSSPREFNDPFDCKVNKIAIDPNCNAWKSELKHLAKKFMPQASRHERRAWVGSVQRDGLYKTPEFERTVRDGLQDGINGHGILCLSQLNNNTLMWSHYADRHRGICLEFDASNSYFSGANPIKYDDEIPLISFPSKGNFNTDIFFTKARSWAYEKEWRIYALNQSGQFFQFQVGALTGIICGMDMPQDDLAELEVMGGEINLKPRLYRAYQKADRNELEIKPL